MKKNRRIHFLSDELYKVELNKDQRKVLRGETANRNSGLTLKGSRKRSQSQESGNLKPPANRKQLLNEYIKKQEAQKTTHHKAKSIVTSPRRHKANHRKIFSDSLMLNLSPKPSPRAQPSERKRSSDYSGLSLSTAFEEEEKESLVSFFSSFFLKNSVVPSTKLEFFKLEYVIGQGAFGKVHKATQKLTGLPVALKLIEKSLLKDEILRRKVLHEVSIHKKIQKPKVVKVLETFETHKFFVIVTEFLGGGNLLNFVKNKTRLVESEAKLIFLEILEATKQVHSCGVLHRDIKLENLLLDTNYRQVKICDFGISKAAERGSFIYETSGTPAYLAPEVIAKQGYSGFSSDIWSLGVCLYAMLCGKVPFKAANTNELQKLIFKGNYHIPEYLSHEAEDLIIQLLVVLPHQRPSINHIMKHPWFKTTSYDVVVCPKFQPVPELKNHLPEEVILSRLEALGFCRDFVTSCLESSQLNHATLTYRLLESNVI